MSRKAYLQGFSISVPCVLREASFSAFLTCDMEMLNTWIISRKHHALPRSASVPEIQHWNYKFPGSLGSDQVFERSVGWHMTRRETSRGIFSFQSLWVRNVLRHISITGTIVTDRAGQESEMITKCQQEQGHFMSLFLPLLSAETSS